MKRGVDYALSGRGTVKSRAKGNKYYNSEQSVKRTQVDEEEGGRDLVKTAKDIFNRILGRE